MLKGSNNKKQEKQKNSIVFSINNNLPNYGNDPFFIKKAKESKDFLEKHGFPKEAMSKK